MRRPPLWTTLIPLALGLGVYWHYWDRQHDAFRADLVRAVGADQRLDVTGFPYRLEAALGALDLRRQAADARARLTAAEAIVNRQPWRPDPTIIRLRQPHLEVVAPGVDGARFDISGATSQTSLRWNGDRIARLSTEIADARLQIGLLPAPATARRFEIHFRETPTTPDPASRSATYPEQAQLVLAGEGVRFGNGDPLKLSAQAGLTAPAPVRSLAAWRTGGTLEVERLVLSDATGEVLTLSATFVPGPGGALRAAGTIDTICPRNVEAALAGRSPPADERRARKPVRLAFEGHPGDYRLDLPVGGIDMLPVRKQEPPCPVIRR